MTLVLLVLALLVFIAAAFNPPIPRVNLVAVGLALVTAAFLVGPVDPYV